MGYYTTYSLNATTEAGKIAIQDFLEREGFEDLGPMCTRAKWYDHDDDMRVLSEQEPNCIFTLEGWGEEKGDWWAKAYFRGEMEERQATPPKVDITNWLIVLQKGDLPTMKDIVL